MLRVVEKRHENRFEKENQTPNGPTWSRAPSKGEIAGEKEEALRARQDSRENCIAPTLGSQQVWLRKGGGMDGLCIADLHLIRCGLSKLSASTQYNRFWPHTHLSLQQYSFEYIKPTKSKCYPRRAI